MKTTVWIVVALLAGMVLGGWGLKVDLRKAKQQIADLQDQLRRDSRKQARLDGITTMLNISPGRTPAEPAAGGAASVGAGTNAPGQGASSQPRRRPGMRRYRDDSTPAARQSVREEIDTAVQLWKTRSELARTSVLQETGATREQATQFDVLMLAMNMRLSNSIRSWVDVIKTEDAMTPESGVRMMNELSGTIVQAYTDMDRDFPDWRVQTEGEFNAMDFVDPQVALPLTEVEEILATQRWERAESFTNSPARP